MSNEFKNLSLQELITMSETNARQMKLEIAKYDKVFEELIKNVPSEDIDKIEKIKILSNKAMSLAKEGKAIEANEVIEQIKKMK